MKCRSLVFLVSSAALIALSSNATAISRIGNYYIQSTVSGFKTSLPRDIFQVASVQPNSTFADRPLLLERTKSKLSSLLILSLQDFAPNFISSTPSEVLGKLKNQWPNYNWRLVESYNSSCQISYIGRNNTELIGIAAWGPHKGVVFKGTYELLSELGIRVMLRDLTLEANACEWKK